MSDRREAGATRLMATTLEEGLAGVWGRSVRIRTMRRKFLSSSSSFRTERLLVTPDVGRPFRVFFKDLNPKRLMPKARKVRRLDSQAADRELQMYRSVLSPERFGTPRLYASRWEPERGRLWMFLEDGGRTMLHNYVDMPRWTSAARWAACFHAATRDLPESQTRFLPRHDREHYRRCAERVEQLLPSLDAPERTLVERGLACFVERIEWLSALPQCVIHGQYFGENIMLRRADAAQRIVVIDWETAARGPGTFDLVSLSSGKWTTQQRQAMSTAYVEQYQLATGQPVDCGAFRQELAGVALYQALEWLAWWGHHRPSKHFANFMRELRAVLDRHPSD
jgi:phosphotransferase family enzyme